MLWTAMLALVVFVGMASLGHAQDESGRKQEFRQILRTYLDGWESGDPEVFDQVLAPDFVDYMYGRLRTREELLAQAADLTFERRIAIDDVLVDDDLAAVRVTSRIQHRESGQHARITGMIIVRIVDGRMIEGWGIHDRLGQLQQLGVIPEGPALSELLRERLRNP